MKLVIPVAWTVALGLTPAGGQVRHLATDHTGSVLYFAADLAESRSSGPVYTRIFRWEPQTGINVFVDQPIRIADSNRTSAGGTGVDSPSVSADGSRVAYMQHVSCSGIGCVRTGSRDYGVAVVTDKTGTGSSFHVWGYEGSFSPAHPARVEVSRNGRFLVCRNGPDGGFGGVREITAIRPGPDFGGTSGLDVPFSAAGTRQMLTDQGNAIWAFDGMLTSGRLTFAEPGGVFRRITEIHAMSSVVSADGRRVVYETLAKDGAKRLLIALDLESGREWFLWADPEIENPGVPLRDGFVRSFFEYPYPQYPVHRFGAAIDDEGRQLAIIAREEVGQPRRWLVMIPLDPSALPRWTFDAGEEILESTISGDGKVVFMTTASGRLLKVNTDSGEPVELLARTPWVREVIGAAETGARNRIVGGGFAVNPVRSETMEGVPELGGFRVEFNGQIMPLSEVTPSEIVFRIPLDFDMRDLDVGPNQGYLLRVTGPTGSGFLPPPLVRSSRLAFGGVRVEPPGAIGEDGQAVNLTRPTRPGETLSILSTGWRRLPTSGASWLRPFARGWSRIFGFRWSRTVRCWRSRACLNSGSSFRRMLTGRSTRVVVCCVWEESPREDSPCNSFFTDEGVA